MTTDNIAPLNQPIDHSTDLTTPSDSYSKDNNLASSPDHEHANPIATALAGAVGGGVVGATFGRLVGGRFGATVGAVVGGVAGAALGSEPGKTAAHQAKDAVQHAVDSASHKTIDVSSSEAKRVELPAETHFELGVALGKQGNLDEAIAEFEQALDLMPDSAETYYNLGVAYSKQGKVDQALQHLQRAKDLCLEENNLQGAEAVEEAIEAVEQTTNISIE